MSQFLQAFDVIAGLAVRIDFVKEVMAEFLVRSLVFENMVDDSQQLMGYGDDGAFLSSSLGDLAILGGEVGVLASRGGPGALTQHAPQPAIGFPRAAAFAFAGAFVVARADARPRGKMFVGGKVGHVHPSFGQKRCGADDVQARHVA